MTFQVPEVHTILLDMDGVMVDDINMFAKMCPEITTSMADHIAKLKVFGQKQQFVFPLINKAIDEGEFAKASPTLFVGALHNILLPYWKSLGIEVKILTSTMAENPKEEELKEQKLEWLKKYKLDHLPVIFSKGSAKKQDHAEKGVLLIDDYDRTIGQFISKGGYAIQYTNLNEVTYKLRLIGLAPSVLV